MAAVTICSHFGAPKIKSLTVSIVLPSICHDLVGPDAVIKLFSLIKKNLNVKFQIFLLLQNMSN